MKAIEAHTRLQQKNCYERQPPKCCGLDHSWQFKERAYCWSKEVERKDPSPLRD